MDGPILSREAHLSGTIGTDAPDQMGFGTGEEAFGNGHGRGGDVVQADGAETLLAEEVDVDVLVVVVVVAQTEFVARHARSSLDDMDEVVGAKQGHRARDDRLVDRQEGGLQFLHRLGPVALQERAGDQHTVGRGPDAVVFHQCIERLLVHILGFAFQLSFSIRRTRRVESVMRTRWSILLPTIHSIWSSASQTTT